MKASVVNTETNEVVRVYENDNAEECATEYAGKLSASTGVKHGVLRADKKGNAEEVKVEAEPEAHEEAPAPKKGRGKK